MQPAAYTTFTVIINCSVLSYLRYSVFYFDVEISSFYFEVTVSLIVDKICN